LKKHLTLAKFLETLYLQSLQLFANLAFIIHRFYNDEKNILSPVCNVLLIGNIFTSTNILVVWANRSQLYFPLLFLGETKNYVHNFSEICQLTNFSTPFYGKWLSRR